MHLSDHWHSRSCLEATEFLKIASFKTVKMPGTLKSVNLPDDPVTCFRICLSSIESRGAKDLAVALDDVLVYLRLQRMTWRRNQSTDQLEVRNSIRIWSCLQTSERRDDSLSLLFIQYFFPIGQLYCPLKTSIHLSRQVSSVDTSY